MNSNDTNQPLREGMSKTEAMKAGYSEGMDGTMRDPWGHSAKDESGYTMRNESGTMRRDDK